MTRITKDRLARLALGSLLMLAGTGSASAQADAGGPPGAAAPSPDAPVVAKDFVRVVEHDDGKRIVLEMGIRELRPVAGAGPTIFLVGAVHVADRPFYQELQALLDGLDIVLYEGVRPPGAGDYAALDDAGKSKATARRVRFVGQMLEMHRDASGGYPPSIAELARQADGRYASLLEHAQTDAWGRPFTLEIKPDQSVPWAFDIISFGADGEPGGAGPSADVRWSAEPPPKKARVAGASGSADQGLQQKLARALGLVFQGDAMSHEGARWRNSDLSIDQVQAKLEAAGAGGEALFRLLDGSSFGARLAGLLLRFVAASPELQASIKVSLMEVLARADEGLANLPGTPRGLFEVLINDRNAVVVEDLTRALAENPKTIGIIYGAGHLLDLEQRIEARLGYRVIGDRWVPAIAVDLSKADPAMVGQVKMMRRMMRQMIEREMGGRAQAQPSPATPSPASPANAPDEKPAPAKP